MNHNIPIPLVRRALGDFLVKLNATSKIKTYATPMRLKTIRMYGTPEVVRQYADACLQTSKCLTKAGLTDELMNVFKIYVQPAEFTFNERELQTIIVRFIAETIDLAKKYATIGDGEGDSELYDILDI